TVLQLCGQTGSEPSIDASWPALLSQICAPTLGATTSRARADRYVTVPSDSTKSSQHCSRMPSPNQPCAASWTCVSSSSSALEPTCHSGWCSMPPYAPPPQLTLTVPALLPNRYGPIVFSIQSNAARRWALPVCAFVCSPGRYHTLSSVPAVVAPSG